MRTLLLLAGLTALAGCSDTAPTSPATPTTQALPQEKGHDEGHDHSSGKMMIAHLGKYHAKLTAHLSAKDGNELDLFVETIDDAPTPVALPTLKLTGVARRDGEEFPLTFEPAPADERPKGEVAGTCSHYVGSFPSVDKFEAIETKSNGLKDISTHPRRVEEDNQMHCYQVILKFDGAEYKPAKKRECECKDEGAKCTSWNE